MRSSNLVAEIISFTRFCIDNGIMIAHAGLLSYRMGFETPIEESICTQRSVVHSRCRCYFLLIDLDIYSPLDSGLTKCSSIGELDFVHSRSEGTSNACNN
jgi:hypothetical protein